MESFTTHTGHLAPLDRANVDTDQIIPKQYLKTVRRTGLKDGLFVDWRTRADGAPNPDFFMNDPRYAAATVLLTRDNFGCGSSREHAPWALRDHGIRAILAPSYADIFRNNCYQNSLLPVTLDAPVIQRLFDRVASDQTVRVTIDLAAQTVTVAPRNDAATAAAGPSSPDDTVAFDIDPFQKRCLLQGLDAIGLTLQREPSIAAYEARRAREAPWLFQDLRA